jgi:hypothetical protein
MDQTYKIITLVVPELTSAVTIQGFHLEFEAAPALGKGVRVVKVPMNLVSELKSHGLMTQEEWKAQVKAQVKAEEDKQEEEEVAAEKKASRRKLLRRGSMKEAAA